MSLLKAASQSIGINITGGSISSSSGLANEKLREGNVRELVNLEDGSVRIVRSGLSQDFVTGCVIGALVVELDVPPIDKSTDGFGDGMICASWVEGSVIGKPRSDRCVGDDVFYTVD
jgi:hypothetical protein